MGKPPKDWKLVFPHLRCPACNNWITVAFFGRYRFSWSAKRNGVPRGQRKQAKANLVADSALLREEGQ